MNGNVISLNIANNTNGIIPVSLMGNYADLSDNANQTTEYRYNVTGLLFTNENVVAIQYKLNNATTYTNYQVPLTNQSLQGVLDALNSLGIGSFFTFTSGGNTYISNYDDIYSFGNLNIYNSSTPILNYYFNTTTVSGYGIGIDVNLVNQVSSANPSTLTGSLNVVGGDSVDFYGSYGSAPYYFYFQILQNGVVIYDNLNSWGAFSQNFVVVAGSTYDLYCYDTPP